MPDLSPSEVHEEETLLVDAVSLLVQRQREIESLVADQVRQAEERAAVTERRYAEVEARLTGIEEQLSRVAQDVEPGRSADAGVGERLARLREQVEGLRSGPDGHPPQFASAPVGSRPSLTPANHKPAPPRPGGAARGQGVGLWNLLGATPQDRFGFVLIGVGLLAVLYAILSQLRLG